MTNVASLLKQEIARVARKELRAALDPLHKINAQQRKGIAALKRKVGQLEKAVRRAPKGAALRAGRGEVLVAEAEPRLRFRPAGLAAHRQRLELSAAEYGRLVGVSGQSIYKWEQGRARPRAAQLQSLAAVRGLGKRESASRLEGTA
jgi:DNA-binding XRE family transcriptional regulator